MALEQTAERPLTFPAGMSLDKSVYLQAQRIEVRELQLLRLLAGAHEPRGAGGVAAFGQRAR